MNRSPEEYFASQDFSVDSPEPGAFTPAEKAFMEKYLDVDGSLALEQLGLASPAPERPDGEARQKPAQAVAAPCQLPDEPEEEALGQEAEIQMVAFFIGGQEFIIPTAFVQEVIRSTSVTRLPTAPEHIAGVMNLRGKITPLIRLGNMLGMDGAGAGEDRFIIICRRAGLQAGLMIERVHTMYRVSRKDIEWGIEARTGIRADYIAGLLKLPDRLVTIVSVDHVIRAIAS